MKAGERQKTQYSGKRYALVSVPGLLSIVTCPSCGSEVDLWTGDDGVRCDECGREIVKGARLVQ